MRLLCCGVALTTAGYAVEGATAPSVESTDSGALLFKVQEGSKVQIQYFDGENSGGLPEVVVTINAMNAAIAEAVGALATQNADALAAADSARVALAAKVTLIENVLLTAESASKSTPLSCHPAVDHAHQQRC